MKNQSSDKLKIFDFEYVMDFFQEYYPELINDIKDIPVYVIDIEDWPEGKSMRTENDRKGGIKIHINHASRDEIDGWLIHEVGHVVDLKSKNDRPYLISPKLYPDYPNAPDEQLAMYFHFQYMLSKSYSESKVIGLLKDSYDDVYNDDGTTWSAYKDEFFRLYYREISKILRAAIDN